jgi:hypothetical protein
MTEQNLCYFVACGLGELKVFSQIVADVLLSMIGFLDDAISNAFCDLRRVEALKHTIEKDGSQRIASVGYGRGAWHARLANPSSLGHHSACTPTVRMEGLSSSIGVPVRVLQRTSTLAFLPFL